MMVSQKVMNEGDNAEPIPAAGWVGQGVLRVTSAPQRATVRVLAKTYPRPLETAAAMEALAFEFPGSAGRRMQQFVWFLQSGVPIVEAIQRTPDLLQPASAMALQLAERSGVFPDKCRSLLQRDASDDPQNRLLGSQSIGETLRVLSGLVIAWFLLTFFAVFIVPTFEAMFNEFGLELPLAFIWLVKIMHWVPVVMPVILMLLLVFVAFRMPAILETLLNRWSPHRGGERELSPPLAVRALLADAVEAKRPLAAGVGDLAMIHPHSAVRRKLQIAAEGARQAPAAWNVFADQGLLSRGEAKVLSAAATESSQAWLLRWFVAKRVGRQTQWSSWWWRVLSLVSLALLAGIVALAAISTFSVLITLISGLS